jgi:ethanolamine ammonia-lyase small subunit
MIKLKDSNTVVTSNPWTQLKQFTSARIALGRTGISLPTQAHLAFQLAHAQARDAVHYRLGVAHFCVALTKTLSCSVADCIALQTQATDRATYLKRPDFGKRLSLEARTRLLAYMSSNDAEAKPFAYDVAFVIADGLSALAIENNAVRVLNAAYEKLQSEHFRVGPFCVVEQGRVAIGDEIGELLRTKLVVVMIGERPGLSSPDSMGIYLTWHPKVGLTDESRNCISNIRNGGLTDAQALLKLSYLVTQAHYRGLTGVTLKDETQATALTNDVTSFLLK